MKHRLVVAAVCASVLAAGLALAASSGSLPRVSAHEQTERVRVRIPPFTREVRVRVPPYLEEYKVRVAPFTEEYEQRVPPFTREVRVRVPPYLEEYKVRVAPFTERVRVPPFTIRTVVFPFVKRVRVAPFTQTRTVIPPCQVHQTPWGPYEHCPKPYTVTEAVYNYEEQPVWGTKDVFNYETRNVFNYETKKRSVFNYETLTEDVFNYETKKRSVFNYETLTEDVFNYEWQERPVAHSHTPEPTPCSLERFDPSTGACWPDPENCGADHTHNGSACHNPDKSHEGECLPGTELQGHSDCIPVTPPESEPTPDPTATATASATATPVATASATATPTPDPTVTPTARAVPVLEVTSVACAAASGGKWTVTAAWEWSGTGTTSFEVGVFRRAAGGFSAFRDLGGAARKVSVVVNEPGEYAVDVLALHRPAGRAKTSVVCEEPRLAAPFSVRAACTAGGDLEVSWATKPSFTARLQAEVEVDAEVVGTVGYARGSTRDSYDWGGAKSNQAHRVRVRLASTPLGLQMGENLASEWSAARTANTCGVFKPQILDGSCNSHGVIHLEWDPVGGADRYDLKNTAPGEESVNYEGPATEVYAQRWEGETYKIRIRARARTGQKWSGWTDPITVQCDPLDPASPVWPQWRSPNGAGLLVTEPDPDNPGETIQRVRHWTNPALERYGPDSTKNPNLGRDNCTETGRNKNDDGWTRTCTIYWSEPMTVRADLAWHPADAPHIHEASHAHRHDDDSDVYGHDAAHHHCTTALARAIISSANPLPGFTGCPTGTPHGDHADFDDGRTGADRLASYAVSGVFSAGTAAIAVALAPVTAGGSVIAWTSAAAGVIGGGVGGEIFYQLSEDGKVVLEMSGQKGCVPTAGWERRTANVESKLTAGSYSTTIRHIIHYCEESEGGG